MDSTHKARTALVFFLFCSLFCIGIINLYTLQIKQHTFFTDLGHQQYYVTQTSYPPRASILDRNKNPLALNKETLSAFMLPRMIKEKTGFKRFLKKNFPEAHERFIKKPNAQFAYIKRKISHKEKKLIEQSGITDIHFLNEPSRFYPIEAAGLLTGMTNIDNKGLFGIELILNEQLTGKPTTTVLEKDARSGHFYFSKQKETKGIDGAPVELTIDGNLQFLVQEELTQAAQKFGSTQGAAVVMDPETGDILAMASYPSFDPNDPIITSQAATKNTAVTESYEFGSVIKTFCALAALEEGLVTADEEIDCLNTKTAFLDGRQVNTVLSLGVATFTDIIKKSNNIGIAKVAKRLDTKIYDHYRRLGFGTKTNIPFPGEQSGFVMPPERWSKQSIISLSYGYEITNTLLQLARAFSVFANDGHLVTPRLLLSQEITEPQKIYSSESINTMRTILEEATSKQGTGKYAAVHGYTTMGKTSTTNLLEDGQYNEHKNTYGFAGIVEKGGYKRIIACFLKESKRHNLYASTVSAPLFEKIAERTLMHDKILT
ncbi:MAG: cell division protein FtsI (penicillin-binding protein 3) [Alteromonas naphthalenivorans]|jgi:cell division protein FtsI (penicillin-binding protein 3)